MILRELPEYRAALAREREERDLAVIASSRTVGGVDIRLVTLRDYLMLSAIGSPYIVGGERTPLAALQFLTYMSVGFCLPENGRLRAWFNRRRVMRLWRRYGIANAMSELEEHLDIVWMDAPGSAEGGESTTPTTSAIVSIIDSMATAYHWTPDVIMALTMPMLFQLYRCRAQASGSTKIMFNKFTDKAARDYVAALNAKGAN
jgi:hypothetical protein